MPPIAAPVQTTNVAEAIGVAVDRPPEEHVLALPLVGYELGVGEQVVERVGVQNRLVLQPFAEFVSKDHLPVLLLGLEVKADLGLVPSELAAFDVLFELPAIRDEGLGVEVDDMVRHHANLTTQEMLYPFETAELVDDSFDRAEVERRILVGSHGKLLL